MRLMSAVLMSMMALDDGTKRALVTRQIVANRYREGELMAFLLSFLSKSSSSECVVCVRRCGKVGTTTVWCKTACGGMCTDI